MKGSKYKIHKQVGIQELAPFKSNVKVFRHLLVAKYTFLYFFHREFINRRLKRLKTNLKTFIQPFLGPLTKMLGTHADEIPKKLKVCDLGKYGFKNLLLNRYNNRHFSNLFREQVRKKKRKKRPTSIPSKYYLRPKKFFKKKLTKVPKKNYTPNTELLSHNFSLFSSINTEPSTLNYNTIKNPFFKFLLLSRKFYLKLTFVNLDNINVKFKFRKTKQRLKKQLLYRIYKLKRTLKSFITSYDLSASLNNYIKKLILFIRFEFFMRKFMKGFAISNMNIKLYALLSLYINNFYKFKYSNKLKYNRTVFIRDFDNKYYDNIGWFSIMDYFFPRFVQSGFQIFMHKDFYNRFLINPLTYKKYLNELTRSENFRRFSRMIMNRKQDRGMKRYFIDLYRGKFKRKKHNPFHGLANYYKTTRKILSFLMNRPVKKYRYYYKDYRLKLFRIKLLKILYGVKRTKDVKKLIKSKIFFSKINKLMSHSINRWVKDLPTSYDVVRILNDRIAYNHKGNFKLGDQISFFLGKNYNLINLNNINLYYFFRLIHFYNNIIIMFENNKLSLFKSFGKYYFFLDAIKYKLGYLCAKYFTLFKELKKKVIKKIKKKNTLPIVHNDAIYYIHLTDPYLLFNKHYIFMGPPFDLQKANLDEFYKRRFDLLRGKKISKRRGRLLKFLNFFNKKLSFYMKIYHNKFHIMRYLQFMKGVKTFITFNFNNGFIGGKYSLIITSTELDLYKDRLITALRSKVHKNKVQELLMGDENEAPIQPNV